jgi:hypothetical protein
MMNPPRRCPICNRPLPQDAEAARFRPFCCKRCADIDLGRWLNGVYGIPATETEDESETGAGPAESSDEITHDGKGPVRH